MSNIFNEQNQMIIRFP